MNEAPRVEKLSQGDENLGQLMRHVLARTRSADTVGLQSRVLAQWEQRVADDPVLAFGPGDILRLLLRSRDIQWGFVALVLVVALGLQSMRMYGDASLEDLLEPDVLSLMALGEL